MQPKDNVIEFPRLNRRRRRSPVGNHVGVLNQRGKNLKGVLTMATSRQSAVRVIKAANKQPRRRQVAAEEQGNGVGDRNEKFRNLALKRVPRALHALQLIENLASHNYKYTPEQADKIVRTLEAGLDKVRNAFNKPVREERVHSFSLP